MDKILNVHNLIEKIAIKYNQFERNTSDEAVIIKKISELENQTSESTIKAFFLLYFSMIKSPY